MSNLKNRVQLIGNVGNEPEIINLESGKKIVKFSLATNESYKNENGEKITKTDWHILTAFDKTAEIIEKYVKKGNEIAVECKLTYHNYDKDNVTRYVTDLIIREVLMFSKKDS